MLNINYKTVQMRIYYNLCIQDSVEYFQILVSDGSVIFSETAYILKH